VSGSIWGLATALSARALAGGADPGLSSPPRPASRSSPARRARCCRRPGADPVSRLPASTSYQHARLALDRRSAGGWFSSPGLEARWAAAPPRCSAAAPSSAAHRAVRIGARRGGGVSPACRRRSSSRCRRVVAAHRVALPVARQRDDHRHLSEYACAHAAICADGRDQRASARRPRRLAAARPWHGARADLWRAVRRCQWGGSRQFRDPLFCAAGRRIQRSRSPRAGAARPSGWPTR